MLPLFERNERTALVGALPLSYRFALIYGGLLGGNPMQLEIQL